MNIFSGKRPPGEKGKVNKGRYEDYDDRYFSWPDEAEEAARHALRMSDEGRNVYGCAHLLLKEKRKKENAASVACLYADGDEAVVPEGIPTPTLTIESSPGRCCYYWRLDRRISPEQAEDLNRRLAYEIGADKSGWDLTQILRLPGTKNYDYAYVYDEVPTVRVVM